MPDLKGIIGDASLKGKIGGKKALSGGMQIGSTNIENDHNLALNRDLPDQHPITAITGLQYELLSRFDDAWVEEGYLILKRGDEELRLGPFAGGGGGGGGGGGTNNAVLTLTNNSGWLAKTISDSEPCILYMSWSSEEDGLETGAGSLTIKVNGSTKLARSVDQGALTIDISSYLSTGSNSVRVSVSDVYGNTKTLSFSVSVVTFSLSSSFNDSIAYNGNVVFPYVATGTATKTMQFILDGDLIASLDVTTSGRQQNFTIPAQSHGAHNFEVFFTAEVNGVTVTSNHLFYDIIFIEDGVDTPIIAVSSNISRANQYYSASIPYVVYTPNRLTSDVTLSINDEVVQTLTVDRVKQTWVFHADKAGESTLCIATGEITKEITIQVIPSSIDIEVETNALDLFLSPIGRSNSETNPNIWEYEDISCDMKFFNNVSNGWVVNDNGNTVLRVSGNARVEVPYKVFSSDIRTTGMTIEFDFSTRDVSDVETNIITCMSGNRGFNFTPQRCKFSSEQTSLEAQYKENEHVRISFVIEKRNENRLVYAYINGIISGIVQYPVNDNFEQADPIGISIGSNYATVDIYAIRIYKNSLTRYQVLNNWIADTADGYTMLMRYNHNNIYDDYGKIVIANLPNDLPYLVLEGPVLPQYKGDKRTIDGYYVDPIQPSKSFSFTNAQIDVQGTSSQYYARKNYKIKFKSGFSMTQSGETTSKYQMRNNSIPTSTFCMKADVASSEGANNVELARLYNDICTYSTPPQKDNPSIRQGIDGFPIVIFWSDGETTSFLGKYNFNNDKGTDEVFGFDTGDESWEILNNTSNRVIWKNADYSGTDWLTDFEARYPEDNTNPINLAAMAAWLVSTNTEAATDEALPATVTYEGVDYTTDSAEYRLAKFKNEIGTYWELDDLIFNYIFTELFLMVDSRAKNVFPTKYASGKWCILPYDYDTALGINNEGALVFSYSCEDTDTTESGADVYNGQQSVLWINLRNAFGNEIKTMYQNLRSNGLSYDNVEGRFEEHQNIWPEAIFNEDAYFKYIQPLIENGEGVYLSMAQGSKATQRQWWLYNRFRYLDSKYQTGDAQSTYINLRAYEIANITVTTAADVYARVKWGSYSTFKRMEKGETYEFVCGMDELNDTETMIFSADRLSSVGDLAPLKVGYANFAAGTMLQEIKLGDSSSEYSNGNLKELYLGNNGLLRTLDCRNCPNLTMAVDLSKCTNIEAVYFGGTSITGVELPEGGLLKTLQLPATITSLIIKTQRFITNLVVPDAAYSHLTTFRIEDSSVLIPLKTIIGKLPSGCRVRLIDSEFYYSYNTATFSATSFLNTLNKFSGMDAQGNNVDKAQVSGFVHVRSISAANYAAIKAQYPELTVHSENSVKVTGVWHNGIFNPPNHTSSDPRGDFRWFDFEVEPNTAYYFDPSAASGSKWVGWYWYDEDLNYLSGEGSYGLWRPSTMPPLNAKYGVMYQGNSHPAGQGYPDPCKSTEAALE